MRELPSRDGERRPVYIHRGASRLTLLPSTKVIPACLLLPWPDCSGTSYQSPEGTLPRRYPIRRGEIQSPLPSLVVVLA